MSPNRRHDIYTSRRVSSKNMKTINLLILLIFAFNVRREEMFFHIRF